MRSVFFVTGALLASRMRGVGPLGKESLSVMSWLIDLRLDGIYFRDTPIVTNRLCVLETLLSCFLGDTSAIRTYEHCYRVRWIFEGYIRDDGNRRTTFFRLVSNDHAIAPT